MTLKRSNDHRVLCVGWHKTSTSSPDHGLVQFGYSAPLLAAEIEAVQDVPRQRYTASLRGRLSYFSFVASCGTSENLSGKCR